MAYTRLTKKSYVAWVPEGGSDPAIYRVMDLDYNTESAIEIASNNTIGQFSALPNRVGGRFMNVAFSTELRGAASAGTIVPEGTLLRACGFKSESLSTPTRRVYTMGDLHLSGDLAATDLVLNFDKMGRKAKDCVGSVGFNFTAGQVPFMAYQFRGNPDIENFPNGANLDDAQGETFTPGLNPAVVRKANLEISYGSGPTTITDDKLTVSSFVYDVGNVIDPRPSMNGETGFGKPILTRREPQAVLMVEATDSDAPFEQLYLGNTELKVVFEHNTGGAAGEKLKVEFSGVISSFPTISAEGGKLIYVVKMQQALGSSATPLTFTWT